MSETQSPHSIDKFSPQPVIPKPPFWDPYAQAIEIAWRDLLEEEAELELALQRFIERFPCLLPFAMAYSPGGEPEFGHHGTLHGAVFTQPDLPGGAVRPRPDFMRITRDSSWTYVTLFELKRTSFTLFRSDQRFRDEYDAAREQVVGYQAWLDDPANKAAFLRKFLIPAAISHRDLFVRLVLLAGRRREVYGHPERRDRRRREQIVIRSLDALLPDANARDDVTVRIHDGRLVVVSVQPTMRVGPFNASGLALMDGIRETVSADRTIPPKRRRFLGERIPFWQAWASAPTIVKAGYRE